MSFFNPPSKQPEGEDIMASASKTRSKRIQQLFSFNAPAASSVLLVGDFTHWQKGPITLRKTPDGIWRTTVSLPPGEYHYRFLVDGEWRDDPECNLRVPNPFGASNAVVRVAAPGRAQK
jgi:1,4-alpha-glucan branching enzyme